MKKKIYFRPQIRSRHPSHSILRTQLPLMPFKSVIRFGSITEISDTVEKGGNRIEINSVQGIKNSASKLLMKQCFTAAEVRTANWWINNSINGQNFVNKALPNTGNVNIKDLTFPIISKSLYGSRGIGNTKHNTKEELEAWMIGKNLSNYIFEEFVSYAREYRLHITENGCFYTCRKLLKTDAPADTWQKHDDHCSWALEDNPSFKKPKNWEAIIADCIKAQKALGLDICAFDVGIQGAKDGVERENPKWVIYESCSAPSFGEITSKKYLEILPTLLTKKHNQLCK